jgi:hypothetical protein
MRCFIPASLFGFILTACVHRPPPLEFGPEGALHSAQEVLARLDAQEQSIQSLKGEGKLGVDSPQAKGSVGLLVAVAPGGRLHLETLDFFGHPVAVLASDGKRFGLWQSQEGRYYRGPASPENLSRFLPVVLPPGELGDLLVGRAPRLEGAELGPLTVDPEEAAYRLTLSRGKAVQTLWVDPRLFRVRKSTVRNIPGYDLSFQRLDPQSGLFHEATLRAPAAKTTLTLTYGDVKPNASPEDGLFAIRPPAHAIVVEVDAHGVPLSTHPDPE